MGKKKFAANFTQKKLAASQKIFYLPLVKTLGRGRKLNPNKKEEDASDIIARHIHGNVGTAHRSNIVFNNDRNIVNVRPKLVRRRVVETNKGSSLEKCIMSKKFTFQEGIDLLTRFHAENIGFKCSFDEDDEYNDKNNLPSSTHNIWDKLEKVKTRVR